jgi:Flp pilus assembly protein TadB
VKLVAALLAAATVWWAAEMASGGRPHLRLPDRQARPPRLSRQAWLSQAGTAVTPGQFVAISAGLGLVGFLLTFAISGAVAASAAPALGLCLAPYGYWSTQRRKLAAARYQAWPDALRYIIGVLGAGLASLHDALDQVSISGPQPLRAPMARYVRLSARVGDRAALEAVRSEMADPISDPVLLAFELAVEEGTATVLRILTELCMQITADLQLHERIRTVQTQSRVATWGCFVAPYGLLLFFCTTNASYREFYSGPGGTVVIVAGALLSLLGMMISRRLIRPIATAERVFVEASVPRRAKPG